MKCRTDQGCLGSVRKCDTLGTVQGAAAGAGTGAEITSEATD